MAGSPQFKVYDKGEYVASVKTTILAAILAGTIQGVVKYGHGKIIWREGLEEIEAGNSYDGAASIMNQRVRKIRA